MPKMTPAHSAKPIGSRQWLSWLLASVMGIGLAVGASGLVLYNDLANQVASSVLSTSNLGSTEPDEVDPSESFNDSFEGRSLNILLMGIDARVGQDGSIINPEDDDETMRSDTTLVMHIAADRQSVTVVSIPRDMWIQLPECVRSDGSISYSQWGQFNWAFSYGALTDDLAGGVACTEDTVEELTGISIDGFAVIDFSAFASMVDALGGVEICLEEELVDDHYLGMTFEEGCQVMDPITATQYARVRHVGDGSDMGRIQRQQGLLGAMVMQAMNANMLTDMSKLYAFMTATLRATTLSPSLGNIRTDMGLANSLKNMDPADFRFTTMPVVTADFDANRLLPKEPANQELWDALMADEPMPEGTVYMDLEGEYFTMLADGTAEPGGNPRTDDEIGSLNGGVY